MKIITRSAIVLTLLGAAVAVPTASAMGQGGLFDPQNRGCRGDKRSISSININDPFVTGSAGRADIFFSDFCNAKWVEVTFNDGVYSVKFVKAFRNATPGDIGVMSGSEFRNGLLTRWTKMLTEVRNVDVCGEVTMTNTTIAADIGPENIPCA
jgi:hypothetical protein